MEADFNSVRRTKIQGDWRDHPVVVCLLTSILVLSAGTVPTYGWYKAVTTKETAVIEARKITFFDELRDHMNRQLELENRRK